MSIFQSSVTFCGHEINEEGIKPKKELIEKILKKDRPKTKKELDSFLSLVQFLAKLHQFKRNKRRIKYDEKNEFNL